MFEREKIGGAQEYLNGEKDNNELCSCCGNTPTDSLYKAVVEKNGIVKIEGTEYQSATLYGWPGKEVQIALPNKNVEKCAAVYMNGVFLCFARHIGEPLGRMMTDLSLQLRMEKHDRAVKMLMMHLLVHELPSGKLLDYVNCAAASVKVLGNSMDGWDDITMKHADDLCKRLYGEDE